MYEDAAALAARWEHVCQRVRQATAAAGRDLDTVRLIAVSKLHPVSAIAVVAQAGQTDFGENYVQEALLKQSSLQHSDFYDKIRWHCIGHVQSRKAKDVAGRFAYIHTVDSLKLAQHLENVLLNTGQQQKILIQVNVGDEPQKSGVNIAEVAQLAKDVCEYCPHLELEGLMCLPPVFDAGMAARPHFALLRQLRDTVQAQLGRKLPHLSMGMSGDFEAAILEGATMVRIGTDIFGQRPLKA